MVPEPDPLLAMAPDHPRLLRLARRLLGDPDAAHDAVAHALARAPAERRGAARAGFLRTAVRNWASNHQRRERNRRRHELAAAPREPVLAPDELLAREQLRRRVADAVLALDEPYRTTVSLVHLEELPVAEVAQRLGVAEATIRVRLHRAHRQLRAKLDRDYGDRRAWAALVGPTPAVVAPGAAAGVLFGVLAMKNVSLPLVAAVLVLAGGGTFWLVAGSGDRAAIAPTLAAAGATAAGVAAAPAQRADALQRDTVAAGPVAAAARIRVLRADGQPASGREYWIWPASLPAWAVVSTADRAMPITLPECSGRTNANGEVAATPGQPLSVRVIDGILATWPKPPAAVHLPPLTELDIALVDAPPLPQWEAFAIPIVPTSNGWMSHHEIVVSRTTADGEVLIAVHSQRVAVDGRTSATLPALPGVAYTPRGHGLGFRVGDLGVQTVLAPGSATLRCEGPEPTARIRALAADGATPLHTALRAFFEYEDAGWLEESTTGEILSNVGEGDLQVTTEFGAEVFTTRLHPGKEGETCIDCVAGRGRRPWQLGVCSDEIHELWWRRGTGDWQQGKLYMSAKAPCLLRHPGQLDVHGLEPAGARVWLLAETGRALEASDGGTGRWLPTTAVQLLDRALTGASANEWSAQLLLPDTVHEAWATFATFHPENRGDEGQGDGRIHRGRMFTVPVGLPLRLVAHTTDGDVVVPWPR